MKVDWSRVVQSSANFGFSILNVKSPRFPKFAIWLGNLAGLTEGWVSWVGLRIGPGSIILRVLIVRSIHARMAAMPLSKRLAIAGAGALLTGLMDAFQQLLPGIEEKILDGGNETLDALKARMKESQAAQKAD